MSHIYQLGSQHFQVSGLRSQVLYLSLNKDVLVFFKDPQSKGSQQLEPLVTNLSQKIQSVMFAFIDLRVYRDVAKMSINTTTPIQSVPQLIFYSNGQPIMRYQGALNSQSIESFIIKAVNMSRSRNSGSGTVVEQPQKVTPQIPSNYNRNVEKKNFRKKPGFASRYENLGGVESDDENTLLVPGDCIPHNMPWHGGGYNNLQTLD